MVNDIYSGDPQMFLEPDGAYLAFKGGQPVMEQGNGNVVLISLFTSPGWCGNALATADEERIGSTFEEVARGPVTLAKLALVKEAAEAAVKAAGFTKVTAVVTNPDGNRIDVALYITDPTGTVSKFTIDPGFLSTFRRSILTYDGQPVTYDGEYITYS